MEKIPPISSFKSVLSEQMLNLLHAYYASDDPLGKFNEITSSRHLKLNKLILEHFESDPQKESIDNPIKTSNQFFNSNKLKL